MTNAITQSSAQVLQNAIETIERLAQEKQQYTDGIKEHYADLKSKGFDLNAVRKIVARRKKGREKAVEEEQVLDAYLVALGEI